MVKAGSRIGILGGTFNPVHNGHLVLAEECLNKLSLDKVLFVPAHTPPHKTIEGDVSASDRLKMLRLAMPLNDSRFEISDYEIKQKRVVYTIETVEYFQAIYGVSSKIFFITGADSAGTLSSWEKIDKLLEVAVFVIASRPGWDINVSLDKKYIGKVLNLEIPYVDISSILVRERVKNGETIEKFVPQLVAEYIYENGFYKHNSGITSHNWVCSKCVDNKI
ncbi:putative nicotinate-nucleotide adenylyltransferase [Candidatus Omnitrophus magneticus]|uniref:Probable nicotinate-nucleotide adenylyltransferase n=1 Tax=Candidatus Omnitrophus magneticus TaxID=1609969 RepID=A0A0F0CLC8_9BACT|nr:putative nicotinate-nucleotide adenylyltransferase [Candidatus Omnitrophus magneticus]